MTIMRKHTALVALALCSAACMQPTGFAQVTMPEVGDKVKGAEAAALLRKIERDRVDVIEERRQALLRAEKAKSPAEKLAIMMELHAAQRERKRQLREDNAKVLDAAKADRETKRRQLPKS